MIQKLSFMQAGLPTACYQGKFLYLFVYSSGEMELNVTQLS